MVHFTIQKTALKPTILGLKGGLCFTAETNTVVRESPGIRELGASVLEGSKNDVISPVLAWFVLH
jgi:hypothetical protein